MSRERLTWVRFPLIGALDQMCSEGSRGGASTWVPPVMASGSGGSFRSMDWPLPSEDHSGHGGAAALLGPGLSWSHQKPPCCPQSIPMALGDGGRGEGKGEMSQLAVESLSGPLLPGLSTCPGLSLSLWPTSFWVSRWVVRKEWKRYACLCDCGYTGRRS